MLACMHACMHACIDVSVLQLQQKGILACIGSALLGSAAGTLMGGAQQALSGPFALNTPQTNLTANLGGAAAPAAVPAAAAAAVPAAAPAATVAAAPAGGAFVSPSLAAAAAPDTSHNITGIIIGVFVGLLALCLIGGCVWKMTKRKKRR